MAAKDLFHDAVKQALLKEQWVITADPLILKIDKVKFEIDLAAEKVFAAEKAGQKIAVEIKSFLSPSPIRDLENAWGQFFLYARALKKREPDRCLYLAISLSTFETIFQEEAGQLIIEEPDFRLIVFDPDHEEIMQWQPQITP